MPCFPLDDCARGSLAAKSPLISEWAEARGDWDQILPPPPNGANHVSDVLRNVISITNGIPREAMLDHQEWDILLLAVLLHDIGRTERCKEALGTNVERAHHSHLSYEYILQNKTVLPVPAQDRVSVATVCRAHGHSRREMEKGGYYTRVSGRPREPLLGAILRLADEVDNAVDRYGPLADQLSHIRREILLPEFEQESGTVVYDHQTGSGIRGVPLEVEIGLYHVWAATVRVMDDTHDDLGQAGIGFSVVRFRPPFDLSGFCHEVMDTGFIAYLPTRTSLEERLPIEGLVRMAKDGGTILVVARTAVRWAQALGRIMSDIVAKQLRVRLAVGTAESTRQIGEWVGADREKSLSELREMMGKYKGLEVRVLPETVQQAITIVETWTGLDLAVLDTPLVTIPDRGSFVLDLANPKLQSLNQQYRKLWCLGLDLREYDDWTGRVRDYVGDLRRRDGLFPSLGGNEAWSVLPRLLNCKRRPMPLCVQVEVTNRCDSRCKSCHRWETGADSQDSDIEPSVWKALTGDLATGPAAAESYNAPTLVLSGGEPLLHQHLPRMIGDAAELGLCLGMYTNGIHLLDNVVESCAANLDWVRVSLDALTPHTYPEVRGLGPDIWFQVMDGCRRLCSAAAAGATRLRKVALSYLIQKDNAQELLGMLDGSGEAYKNLRRCAEWGLRVYFKFPTRVLRDDREDAREELVPSRDVVLELLDKARDCVGTSPLLAHATNLRYLLSKFEDDGTGGARYTACDVAAGHPLRSWLRARPARCHVASFAAVVDYHGRCFPCCYEADDNASISEEWHFGRASRNLGTVDKPGSFWDAWYGAEWRTWQPARECGWCTRFAEYNVLLEAWEGKHEFWKLAQPYPPPVWL